MITMSVVDLVTILGIDNTGPLIPAGRQVIEKLREQYSVTVNYTIRGADPASALEITFLDPRQECLFKLKYSEYL